MSEQKQRFAIITDEALDSLRKLIDVPIEDTLEPWCYEATRDNIRHYAHGIGDDNPLWCDPGVRSPSAVRQDYCPAVVRLPAESGLEWLCGWTARDSCDVGRRRSDLA